MSRREFKEGFTIIEVLLVLSIAGLIFLMAFIALPSLQRQGRDTERREDMAQLMSAIKSYQQNNRGALPSDDAWDSSLGKYLKDDFKDPGGADYVLNVSKCNASAVGVNCDINDGISTHGFSSGDPAVYIVREAKCSGEKAVYGSNPRRFAVLLNLENGGIFCEDS